MDPGALLLPLAAAALAAAGLVGWRWDRRHREVLQQLAAARGWSWTARDDSWADRFDGTPFGTGDRRRARNVLRGTYAGRQLVAFDYSFVTATTDGNGQRRTTTHCFTVCALALPAPVPRVQVTPASFLTRALRLTDVPLESEEFNRRYRVATDHPRFAYDVLHPRAMAGLLAAPALNLRLAGTEALSWDGGRTTPADLLARLEVLSRLVDGVPAYVWKDLGAAP